MSYKLEIVNGKWRVWSPKIGMYLMKDVTMDEVKIALVTEMEYTVKLDIVKLLMTFPHGYKTVDGQVIVRHKAVEDYEAWYQKTYQQIGNLEKYHALIDQQIVDVLSA